MKNAIRGITKGERSVILMSFILGLMLSAVLAISVVSAGTIGDPWVFGFVVTLVVSGWLPFAYMVHEAQHNVDGWHYEAGCYDRWIEYAGVDMHIFVSKRPKVKDAYRLAFMADDYDDPFEGHCLTIVHEYDDYGPLYRVLSHAETVAYGLIQNELPF
jgi:hypothetical protein